MLLLLFLMFISKIMIWNWDRITLLLIAFFLLTTLMWQEDPESLRIRLRKSGVGCSSHQSSDDSSRCSTIKFSRAFLAATC